MTIWVEILRRHSNMDSENSALLAVTAARQYGDPQTIMAVEKMALEKYPGIFDQPYDIDDLIKDMGIEK